MNEREMIKMIKITIGVFFFEGNPVGLVDAQGYSPRESLYYQVLGENYTQASKKRFEKSLDHVLQNILGVMSPAQSKRFRKELGLK